MSNIEKGPGMGPSNEDDQNKEFHRPENDETFVPEASDLNKYEELNQKAVEPEPETGSISDTPDDVQSSVENAKGADAEQDVNMSPLKARVEADRAEKANQKQAEQDQVTVGAGDTQIDPLNAEKVEKLKQDMILGKSERNNQDSDAGQGMSTELIETPEGEKYFRLVQENKEGKEGRMERLLAYGKAKVSQMKGAVSRIGESIGQYAGNEYKEVLERDAQISPEKERAVVKVILNEKKNDPKSITLLEEKADKLAKGFFEDEEVRKTYGGSSEAPTIESELKEFKSKSDAAEKTIIDDLDAVTSDELDAAVTTATAVEVETAPDGVIPPTETINVSSGGSAGNQPEVSKITFKQEKVTQEHSQAKLRSFLLGMKAMTKGVANAYGKGGFKEMRKVLAQHVEYWAKRQVAFAGRNVNQMEMYRAQDAARYFRALAVEEERDIAKKTRFEVHGQNMTNLYEEYKRQGEEIAAQSEEIQQLKAALETIQNSGTQEQYNSELKQPSGDIQNVATPEVAQQTTLENNHQEQEQTIEEGPNQWKTQLDQALQEYIQSSKTSKKGLNKFKLWGGGKKKRHSDWKKVSSLIAEIDVAMTSEEQKNMFFNQTAKKYARSNGWAEKWAPAAKFDLN